MNAVRALGLAALLALAAAGCAKHRWLQEAGRASPPDAAGDRGTTGSQSHPLQRQPLAAAADDTTAAQAADEPDPVASGAAPLAMRATRVSAELPWEHDEEAGAGLAASPPQPAESQALYWLQVAALGDSAGAGLLLVAARRLAGGEDPLPDGEIVWERGFWKLRVGPFAEWLSADLALQRLRAGGHPGAWLIRR